MGIYRMICVWMDGWMDAKIVYTSRFRFHAIIVYTSRFQSKNGLVGKTLVDPVRVFCPIQTHHSVHMRQKTELSIFLIFLFISIEFHYSPFRGNRGGVCSIFETPIYHIACLPRAEGPQSAACPTQNATIHSKRQ